MNFHVILVQGAMLIFSVSFQFGGMGWLRWRKGRYGSREQDIFIYRIILEIARDLALEGIPGVHRDVPS